MKRAGHLKIWLLGTACGAGLATTALATNFNVPGGSLEAALNAYSTQSGVQLMIPADAIGGIHSRGVRGDLPAVDALSRILSGTGFTARRDSSGVIGIVPEAHSQLDVTPIQLAQAAPARAAVETVTVTSSKLGGADVQSIPIAITALSQEQLTATQTAGGPDLVKQVPNLTFTKTNFTGYSIQIRGIGTQAISVTTDPAVAVAFNDIPFIRNHFFEQEFFDVGQLEVLRGPQGTLYGRNATAGVVNLISAKPSDQFEATASGEIGNYSQRRFEGMLNLPIVDDRLDIRFAGEWTKRQGYSYNEITDNRIDGRDLWSGRVTIGLKPVQNLQMYLVWEHFSESDDRMRSAKQLCKTAPTPTEIGGRPIAQGQGGYDGVDTYVSQGCEAASLYSPDSFQVPNGYSLPYYGATGGIGNSVYPDVDPYASTTQSTNLRIIESALQPVYKSKNDILELNADYAVLPTLTFTSQTAFNHDFLWSTEDYNRFNTTPGVFNPHSLGNTVNSHPVSDAGVFCDPQLGCSDRLVAEDLAQERSWQFNQEFRLASNFSGPFNFTAGGNYMHYETHENYYVFINSLSMLAADGVQLGPDSHATTPQYVAGVSDNHECLSYGKQPGNPTLVSPIIGCIYMDPNPITNLNDKGHNYFLSQNPYVLNSYAAFGEANYSIFSNLKLTAGLRWTEDRKHAPQIPSELLVAFSYGYPALTPVDQQWDQITGRTVLNWTPTLRFTDQTLVYSSYAHGYKAGGANPPPTVLVAADVTGSFLGQPNSAESATHPTTFKPEFIDAFEVGTKNTLLDGALTLNADVFYYNYENYQISEIVDRTSINLNFDAHVKGAEIEATYEPVPGLRFNFSGGYENARLAQGDKAIDLMDRTAGNPDWMVVKPFPTNPSNCIIPVYLAAEGYGLHGNCADFYTSTPLAEHYDPVTQLPYAPPPPGGYPGHPNYPGFDVASAPNNGEGFYKDLGGNVMPNAPPFTVSFGAQYTMPLTQDWAGTLRTDFYWQDNSWWRVFNDLEYDKLHGYSNVNLTLILTNQNGWQVMLYDKNVFNTTAITGAFLNSDDSGLTTNVFLTDPKLIGVRITKNW